MPRIAVIYYSSTGTTHQVARAVLAGAESAGAEGRLVRAAELAPPDVVAGRPAWARHLEETADVPVATPEDLVWADGVVMGTPTRFGNVASQLKQFLDTLGPSWAQGLLADKVYSGFTSTDTPHGGQESTLLALYTTFHHFGGVIVAPGYTNPERDVALNPYGSSHVGAGGTVPVSSTTIAAAEHQGRRVTRMAAALRAAR